jgi:hypothetical protein
LNKLIEGPHVNTLTQNGGFNAFMKKLELWKTDIEPNILYIFRTFERFNPSNEREANNKNAYEPVG